MHSARRRDPLNWRLDVALGYGGWSFTAAYNGWPRSTDADVGPFAT